MSNVRRWWTAPDHFEWLSTYLTAHRARRFASLVIGALMFSMGMLELLSMFAVEAPTGIARIGSATVVAACLAMAPMWLRRQWPTHRQSLVFVVASALTIMVACLAEPNPLSALVACTQFSLLGGYIAFFHSARFMVFNITLAICTAAALAIRVAATDPLLAVTKLLAVTAVTTAIPLLCQMVIQVLGPDVADSEADPLTGLLNRRGFGRRAGELLEQRQPRRNGHLVLAMVDLDRFKTINDTEGHAAGDQALIAVSRAIQANTRDGAVIARVGGEEFLIADTTCNADVNGISERLTTAIANLGVNVTASVGTVTLPLRHTDQHSATALLESLIQIADRAMYAAKRAGGNRFHHVGVSNAAALDTPGSATP